MVQYYEFDVSITCRHEGCDESFKNLAIDQVHSLSRYHSHIIDGNIRVNKENSSYKVEITLRVPGHILKAEHVEYNQMKAFDAAIEKVKIQLKKQKDKEIKHRVTPQFQENTNPESENS